ncbi:MAG: lipopolysaccharide transport periplasmic protein LptA [Rubrivivax sp.]|nr:lipopolysaccharide transport periplasmic protein LptA [Rubrivivax sp.]
MLRRNTLLLALTALSGLAGPAALAERADRSKPIIIEAERGSTFDLQRQVTVLNGNAVIVQGTMVLRGDRIELRETPDGYRAASAIGAPGKPASWRQKRDGPGEEVVEGTADRIDFDGRADTLRLVGNSSVRRLRAGVVADDINGATIVWDNVAEVFRVEGGASSAANPGGRVRLTLSPRAEGAASAPPASASAPLLPSRTLEDKR